MYSLWIVWQTAIGLALGLVLDDKAANEVIR